MKAGGAVIENNNNGILSSAKSCGHVTFMIFANKTIANGAALPG
jgi:hypothetical protein